ncbi:hypothetical protein P255_02984 [Acinetobacter brisouii CIP 110357]|uniref:Uncharacterized protein n=1 Tax=Acinetobacter brisouii CIP 110357 TaxID=1341683 RepID=V2UAK1_9GAMM|nr:hypothetical protein [Acinetobacter brisouii]ENV46183.1 hypothetical protein F954_02818 [Acinetobacter brisouii ANC 4119]ESK47502.1 hypothetical protein P255_02984 [Acinetobacter brisouii CIP 110357]
MAKKRYFSLQGELFLAELINGVAGSLYPVGNTPSFQISVTATVVKHNESSTGIRAVDDVMTKDMGVKFETELEEGTAKNLEFLLSSYSKDVAEDTLPKTSLGTVVAGEMIRLGKYNLSEFVLNDSAATPKVVDPSKYVLDAPFGTLIVNDIDGLTMPLTYTAKTGKVTKVGIATDFSKEYLLFFKGKNTAGNKEKMAVTLWRTMKTPDVDFPMIHEEYGKWKVSGMALPDSTQVTDEDLGNFGEFVFI